MNEATPTRPNPAGQDDDTADEVNLEASLAALAQLSSGRLSLEELLAQVAGNAVRAIPGADGAGLTLLEPDRDDLVVKSADFVRLIDDIQYGLGEGPCISAATHGQTVRSGALGTDPRWPKFGPRAGRLGVHSVLSLPLTTPAGVVGAMNVYAHAPDAFDDRAEQLGELYAAPAAVTVHNAQILAQTQRLTVQLQTALANRPVIEQAIGILRARSGLTADQARERLRSMSRSQRAPMNAVAQELLDHAVRRATARHTNPPPDQP